MTTINSDSMLSLADSPLIAIFPGVYVWVLKIMPYLLKYGEISLAIIELSQISNIKKLVA